MFPNVLKLAKAVPIYNKGDTDNPGSYRFIAILPVLGKIFEVIMKRQTVNYLEKEVILSSAQHGIKKGRSTVSALASLLGNIYEAFEDGESITMIMCDLSKAF